MAAIPSIALSGMNAAQNRLNAAAHNVANLNTPGFNRQEVVDTPASRGGVNSALRAASTPGSSLEADVVSQLQAKNAFMANLAVFKAHDKNMGALLDQSV